DVGRSMFKRTIANRRRQPKRPEDRGWPPLPKPVPAAAETSTATAEEIKPFLRVPLGATGATVLDGF
ncbi:MAG: hypothetical protein L0Z53_27240, partial [Acidobacteriales bacterium]|nr:hypothetical protein [Terriglobales bacterium]